MSSQQTRDLFLRHALVRQALAEGRFQHAQNELNQVRSHIERRFCSNYGPVAPLPSTTTASRAVQPIPRPVQQAAAASSSSSYSAMQNPSTTTQRTQPSPGNATQQPGGQNVQGTTGNPVYGNPGATAQVTPVDAARRQHPWRVGSNEELWGAGTRRPNGNNP